MLYCYGSYRRWLFARSSVRCSWHVIIVHNLASITLQPTGMNYIGSFLLLVFKSCESDYSDGEIENSDAVKLDTGDDELNDYSGKDGDKMPITSAFDSLAKHMSSLQLPQVTDGKE
jgi:hypothetical protein